MKRPLFDVTVPYINKKQLFQGIENGKHYNLVTLNPELMLEAHRHSHFRSTINQCNAAVVDGSGLAVVLRILGHQTPPRLTGADLVVQFLKSGLPCYLLGGLHDEAGTARQWVSKNWPEANIVGAESGGTLARNNPVVSLELLSRINDSKAKVLLVGFGAPRQEFWINAALDRLSTIQVAVGVGGALGFLSQKPRAPQVWRKMGVEWLYRGLVEPSHWARIFQAVVVFPVTALLWQLLPKRKQFSQQTSPTKNLSDDPFQQQ